MSLIRGINCFTAVAIKSRIGDDVSRFATKKHLSYHAPNAKFR